MAGFNVGDGVFAKVPGFEPFPAVVESIVLNECEPCLYYHIKFFGSKQVVALDAESLLPFEENKTAFKLNYSKFELEKGAKKRETVLLGKDDEFPEVLMNFITADEKFEEVSTDDMKRLGLSNIILSASDLIKNMENVSLRSHGNTQQKMEEDFVDIEEVSWQGTQSYILQNQIEEELPFSCNSCHKSYVSITSLRRHKKHCLMCLNTEVRKQASIVNARRKKKILMSARLRAKAQRKIVDFEPSASVGSVSSASDDGSPDEKGSTKHNFLERERRAELAKRFAELSGAIGLRSELSKVAILAAAKSEIHQLISQEVALQRQMALLKDINLRLNARLLALPGSV